MQPNSNIEALREDAWRELSSGIDLHDVHIRICQKWATEFNPAIIAVNVGIIASKDFVCGKIPFRALGIITDLKFSE